MRIIMLILVSLLIISSLKPSSLKINTLKKLAESMLKAINSDKTKFEAFASIGILFCIVCCIIFALYIHTVIFTFVMIFWIVQSIFEANITSKYIREGIESKLLNSALYRIVSKIVDTGIYVYIIYFSIINW
jgi:hypothetical protein